MESQTVAHLRVAESNRDLADSLARQAIVPPVHGWIAVIAFYGAVHYVNAYLWELERYGPLSHGERPARVRSTASLRRATFAYRRLSQVAYDMRHDPYAVVSPAIADEALRNLGVVERVLRAALPPEAPPVPTPPTAPTA